MALDYTAIRAITQRALNRGAIQKVSEPEPVAEEAPDIPLAESAALDFALLNQVFGLALNSALSPLRVVRAIHTQWTRMSPSERAQIPAVVHEMVEGLQCTLLSIKPGPVQADPIPVLITFNAASTASITPESRDRFNDLVLRLEGSAGWPVIRPLLHHCHIGDGIILMQGPLVSSVQSDLKSILEDLQRCPASQENLLPRLIG